MMNRIYFIITLIVLLTSCTQERHVIVKIDNGGTDTILVQYAKPNYVGSTNFDTTILLMLPAASDTIWDYVYPPSKTYNDNWYLIYDKTKIIYIENLAGDTIKFDPNVAQYWQYTSGNPNTYYTLILNDSLF